MLGSGIIVGSVGVLVRPVAKGLNSSISKAFAGSSGAARKAGQQAGKAFADPVAAEGGKLPGRALGPLRSRAASEAGTAGASAGTSFMSRVVSGIGSAAGTVASTLGRVLKGGAVVGGTAAVAGLGYTLSKGFGRLSSIENAESKLKGLGHSAGNVESIMNNALASVKGTSYGMDEAATTAASAVAAGIEPGQELEKYLGLVGDAAAIAGTDMASMGSIFNKVATSGKVQGDIFAQLGDQGIPIVQLLAEEMGVTAEEVYKLGADGEISSEMFLKAMSSMEGAALEAGNTTTGALKNAGAAISRLGATLLGGFYPMIGQIARRFTELVDVVEAKVGPIIASLMESFSGSATAGIDGFFDTLIGWVENFDPEPMIAFFGRVADVAKNVFTEITGGLRAFGAAWAANDGDITSSGFPGFMERAAYLVRQLWESVKNLDFSSFGGFAESLSGALGGIGSSPALSGVGGALSQIAAASPTLLASGIKVLGSAMEFLAKHADTIVKILPLVIAGFAAWKLHAAATNQMLTTQRLTTAAMSPVMLANNALILANNVLEGQRARAAATSTAATNVQTAATTRATLAERARTIATKIGTIASKAAAVATRLLGAAIRFATGPIGLIITGITLLVGALVLFFKKTETGKAIWQTVWTAIKNAAAAVVDWFMTTALPFLQAAWNGIAAGALWLYHSAILPAWNGIRAAIGAVANWITGTLWPAIQTAWNAIGAAAMWLWQSVIVPAWDGIRLVIAVVVTAVLVYIDLLKWYFTNVIAPVALWLWNNVMVPAWNGIKAAIGAVASWIVNVAWPLIKSAWDAIAAAAMWLWNNALKPAWAGIKAAISAVVSWLVVTAWPIIQRVIDWIGRAFGALKLTLGMYWSAIQWAIAAVVGWFRDTAWPVISSVINWMRSKFEAFKVGLSIIWSFIRNNVIGPVVAWFRDTVWPLFSRIIGQIRDRFSWFRDRLSEIWSFIRDKIINPVVNWFFDSVKPRIDDFIGKVKDGFTNLEDGVLKAWDGIRDGLKKPINGVIDIYNDHIAGNFNKVIETIFGKDGAKKYKLTEMTPFARGGILPGRSSWRDGDDQIISARRGEGMLVSEGLRDRKSQSLFLRANHEARTRGTSFADFVSGAFAGGGIVKLRSPFSGSYPRGDGFGARGGRHKGIDWPMPSGAILKAVGAGSVSHSWNPSAGKKLELSIGNGLVAGYHHLSSYIAGRGAQVGAGADVARVGSTGRSSGPHLHFSLKRDGKYVDPLPYLGGGGASGTGEGGGSWWNPFDGLWASIKEKVATAVGGGTAGAMLSKVVENTVGGIGDWVTGKLGEVGDWGMEQVDGAVQGVKATRWTPVATQALSMEGAFSGANLQALLRRMNQESGFNPRAINNWDSNARKGIPSKGLMQVIDPTFRAYARPGYDKDIYDPLSNILASIRYTRSRYSSLQAGWNRRGGYAGGGIVGDRPTLFDQGGELPPGLTTVLNASRKPEAVLTNDQLKQLRVIASRPAERAGDTFIGHGYTPEQLARAWRVEEKKKEALYAH
ncbi:tape measure protein [Brachybacterium paraconglomeratum]|uniref:tape measure protein n=1 Tax=Brachybacterium paraconglomeratum TaxID=173362 RepID=UPI0022AF2AB5|nr:tape measure protein [Brachybacterium paraconglomeratum]MCZ4325667.1 tape measure protein [Brachybacterium paraconglomeratum]